MPGRLYEIRDYHYRADRMDLYRTWAASAARVLATKLDVVGFWVDAGIPARITGAEPMDLPHGSAAVTWIIRWDDLDHRERVWESLWDDADWLAEWEKHPGSDGYLHMSVRFMREA